MADYRWLFVEQQGTSTSNMLQPGGEGTLGPAAIWSGKGRYLYNGYVQMPSQTPDAYIDFTPLPGQLGTDVFTVCFWFATNESSVPLWDMLGNRNEASQGNFLSIRMNSAGALSAEVCQDEQGTNYIGVQTTGPALNDGNWHHVAVVRAGPTLNIYIDGVSNAVGVGDDAANINNNNSLRLGCSIIADMTGDCYYMDLCVFGDQLSEDHILHLYHFH